MNGEDGRSLLALSALVTATKRNSEPSPMQTDIDQMMALAFKPKTWQSIMCEIDVMDASFAMNIVKARRNRARSTRLILVF